MPRHFPHRQKLPSILRMLGVQKHFEDIVSTLEIVPVSLFTTSGGYLYEMLLALI